MIMLHTQISNETRDPRNETEMTALRKKINCLCLHVKNYYDQKAKTKIGLKVFAFVRLLTMILDNIFIGL